MSFDEENLGFLHKRLVQGKDKCEIFLKQREFHLEIKTQKLNQMEPNKVKEAPPVYNIITNDIWYHVSQHIPPEQVQTFALICRQTAALVRTKSFWKHLYLKYCQKFDRNIWILQLPVHLQLHNIRYHNPHIFRSCVIEALFYSYAPLLKRLHSYSLDLLIGRTYISAWQKIYDECMWFICYQFKQYSNVPSSSKTALKKAPMNVLSNEIVNDWESLVSNESEDESGGDDKNEEICFLADKENPYDGVCLLLIFGPRFIPFPAELTYGANTSSNNLRLGAIRRLLTSDMREYNLELDLVNAINKNVTTIKYPTAKHLVVPWWHPEFKKCIRFEAHDKFS